MSAVVSRKSRSPAFEPSASDVDFDGVQEDVVLRNDTSGRVVGRRVTVQKGVVVDGAIKAETVVVHGHVRGRISAGHVEVMIGASVSGEIHAPALRVEGKAEGLVHAVNLSLRRTGSIQGAVMAERFGSEPGCSFDAPMVVRSGCFHDKDLLTRLRQVVTPEPVPESPKVSEVVKIVSARREPSAAPFMVERPVDTVAHVEPDVGWAEVTEVAEASAPSDEEANEATKPTAEGDVEGRVASAHNVVDFIQERASARASETVGILESSGVPESGSVAPAAVDFAMLDEVAEDFGASGPDDAADEAPMPTQAIQVEGSRPDAYVPEVVGAPVPEVHAVASAPDVAHLRGPASAVAAAAQAVEVSSAIGLLLLRRRQAVAAPLPKVPDFMAAPPAKGDVDGVDEAANEAEADYPQPFLIKR